MATASVKYYSFVHIRSTILHSYTFLQSQVNLVHYEPKFNFIKMYSPGDDLLHAHPRKSKLHAKESTLVYMPLDGTNHKRIINREQGGSVGIAVGYQLDDPEFASISLHIVQTGSGAHPASCLMGTGLSSREQIG
jgi:hypothetical protein